MEKSFKSLSEGRAAGIKQVQQEVLGVSAEESDALMEGLLGESVSTTTETEDDPAVSTETIEPPEKGKKKKQKAKEKPVEPLEPNDEATEGEEKDAEPQEATLDPIKPKKSKKVKKSIIPLSKVLPPGT